MILRRAGSLLLILSALPGCTVLPGTATDSRNPHYLDQAETHFLRAEYAQAAGYYEEFVRDNPGHAERARILVKAGRCHLGAGKPDPALRALDEAAAGADPALRAEIVFRRAVAWRMKGDFARALDALRSCSPSAAVTADEIHYETALGHFRAGDWSSGQASLRSVSDRGPFKKEKATGLALQTFAVHVGEFPQEAQARVTETRVKRHAPASAVLPVRYEEPLYVVTAGAFPRHDEAQREADRLRTLGFPSARVIP